MRKSKRALLILDMINNLDFPEGKQIKPPAIKAAKKILKLKQRCYEHRIPVIYLNDNFDYWQADWKRIFSICTEKDCLGKELAQLMRPNEKDFFVLKPKHSGFYNTTLEVLLRHLGVQEVILTGIAGNICVLFTAHDAHMRDFKVVVPKDCIASNTPNDNQYALNQFEKVFGFKTTPSTSLRLKSS